VKNLVFTSAGQREFRDKDNKPLVNNNPINEWTKGLKDFDLVTYCYDDTDIGKDKSNLWIRRPGFTKYQNFNHYASFYPKHLEQYDYVWVVDDDMFMSTDDINKMFQMMEDYNLDLAQSSISLDGMNYVQMFAHDSRYTLRYTNYVECCAMLLSKRGLEKVKRTFSETVTGWGWDALVSDMILEKENVAVLDSVQAYHGMSMSSINKVLPRELHRVEGKKLLEKYNKLNVLERREVLSGIELNGKHLDITFYKPEAETQYIVKVNLGDKITWKPALIQRK
jgi:hypothetical protein